MICEFKCDKLRQTRNSRKKGLPMTTKIFVNLPVRNLENSIRFFKTLGFSFNDLDGHIWEIMWIDSAHAHA